jgi:hypothetical protein
MAVGWRGQWRRQYGLHIAGLAMVGAVAVLLAAQTGESLEHSVREAARATGTPRVSFGDHPEQGSTARIFAVLFAIGAAGLWVLETWRERLRLQTWTAPAAYAATSVLGLAAVVTIVIAGHSGAALVWKDVGNFVSKKP